MTPADMQSAGVFSIPPSHPALPGHFPGRPVVPGVVLLDEALGLLQVARAGTPRALRWAKFFRPVMPGDVIEVRYAAEGAGLAFVCLRGEQVVLGARLGLAQDRAG